MMYDQDEDINNVIEQAISELKKMSVIDNHQILFSRSKVLNSAFPMPAIKNINNLNRMLANLNSLGLNILVLAGINSSEDLFFQFNVLPDLYKKLML